MKYKFILFSTWLLKSPGIVLTQLVVDDCRYRTVEATGDPNAIPVS